MLLDGMALNELLIVDCRLAWDYGERLCVFMVSPPETHRRPELTTIRSSSARSLGSAVLSRESQDSTIAPVVEVGIPGFGYQINKHSRARISSPPGLRAGAGGGGGTGGWEGCEIDFVALGVHAAA